MVDIADKFQAPIGIPATLLNGMWEPMTNPYQEKHWRSVNNFTHFYYLGPGQTNPAYHTGDDLNLNLPGNWDADQHSPVWAAANGTVIYSHKVFLISGQESTWGNLIVLEHTLPDGSLVYSRYGHLEKPLVATGDTVTRGQQIASVGNADGLMPYHLHFDMCVTSLLKNNPPQWPAMNLAQLKANYTDPYLFVKSRLADMPIITPDPLPTTLVTAKATDSLIARQGPAKSYPQMGSYKPGATVIYNSASAKLDPVSGFHYVETPDDMWVAKEYLADVVATAPRPQVNKYVNTDAGFTLNVRTGQSASAQIVAKLARGTMISVFTDVAPVNGYVQFSSPVYGDADYVAIAYLSDTAPK